MTGRTRKRADDDIEVTEVGKTRRTTTSNTAASSSSTTTNDNTNDNNNDDDMIDLTEDTPQKPTRPKRRTPATTSTTSTNTAKKTTKPTTTTTTTTTTTAIPLEDDLIEITGSVAGPSSSSSSSTTLAATAASKTAATAYPAVDLTSEAIPFHKLSEEAQKEARRREQERIASRYTSSSSIANQNRLPGNSMKRYGLFLFMSKRTCRVFDVENVRLLSSIDCKKNWQK